MLEAIIEIVRECGKIILDPPAKEVGSKNRNPKDLVTSCDIQIQEILRQKLTALLPEASFLGEEGSTDYRRDGDCFVCDPIDGTVNFVKNYRWSCVSVALLKDGRPQTGVVFNPFADELCPAEKGKGAFLNRRPIRTSADSLDFSLAAFGTGTYDMNLTWKLAAAYCEKALDIRRSGAGALDLCNVACGRTGIFWELTLKPWDFAAGALIVEEAGGSIKNYDGSPLTDYFAVQSVFALANPKIPILKV